VLLVLRGVIANEAAAPARDPLLLLVVLELFLRALHGRLPPSLSAAASFGGAETGELDAEG
jgi:hypothetical protein